MNSFTKHLKVRLRKRFFIHSLSHGFIARRPQKKKSRGPKGIQLWVLPPKAAQTTTLNKIGQMLNWLQYLYQEELTPADIPTGILLSYSETKSCEDCLAIVVEELRYQCGSGQPPSNTVSCSQSCYSSQLVRQTFQNLDFLFCENGILWAIFHGCSLNKKLFCQHFFIIWVAMSHIPIKS